MSVMNELKKNNSSETNWDMVDVPTDKTTDRPELPSLDKSFLKKLPEKQESVTDNFKNNSSKKNAKPFLKWAGGKQQLLMRFEPYFPSNFQRYFEPFVGGGAVFFHLSNNRSLPKATYLFDNNQELINAYLMVRDNLGELIEILKRHKRKHNKDYYYQVRNLDRKNIYLSNVERAARTLYLNKTCYNGLYRVNSKGQFNVPMGSYKNPKIFDEDLLEGASGALQGVTVEVRDFRSVVELAQPGDFYYFDPPYDPVSKTSSFTGYTAGNFNNQDQKELADVFAKLSAIGCYCMLSNSHTPYVRELYKNFRIEIVKANRAINSKSNGRGAIEEVVAMNY